MYLTLDLGTSALKIALFDRRGRLHALSRQRYHEPHEHEVPPGAVWDALAAGVRTVLEAAHTAPSAVAAIGLASQTNSFILLDADGRERTTIDLWTNATAAAEADALSQSWSAASLYAATGLDAIAPCHVLAKLVRRRRRQSDEAMRSYRVRLLPDCVIERLGADACSDGSLWSLTGFYDLRRGAWWTEALDAAGIRAEQLPRLRRPGESAGRTGQGAARIGLPAGIPIAVGSLDHVAAAVAAGNFDADGVSESTGTVQCVVSSTPTCPSARAGVIIGPHADARAGYYRLAYSPIGAVWLEAYARQAHISLEALHEVAARAGNIEPGCGGLVASAASPDDPAVVPEFRDASTGRARSPDSPAHAVRALMEAVGCQLVDMIDRFDLPSRPQRVRSLGGGATWPAWLQIKADMLGIPVETLTCPEAASLGAAMYAAVAAGQFPSLRAAHEAWHRAGMCFVPDALRHVRHSEQRRSARSAIQ